MYGFRKSFSEQLNDHKTLRDYIVYQSLSPQEHFLKFLSEPKLENMDIYGGSNVRQTQYLEPFILQVLLPRAPSDWFAAENTADDTVRSNNQSLFWVKASLMRNKKDIPDGFFTDYTKSWRILPNRTAKPIKPSNESPVKYWLMNNGEYGFKTTLDKLLVRRLSRGKQVFNIKFQLMYNNNMNPKELGNPLISTNSFGVRGAKSINSKSPKIKIEDFTIKSLEPNIGGQNGNDFITIEGTFLGGTTAKSIKDSDVVFHKTNMHGYARGVCVTPSQITARTPPSPDGAPGMSLVTISGCTGTAKFLYLKDQNSRDKSQIYSRQQQYWANKTQLDKEFNNTSNTDSQNRNNNRNTENNQHDDISVKTN